MKKAPEQRTPRMLDGMNLGAQDPQALAPTTKAPASAGPLKLYNFRIHQGDYERLKAYCDAERIPVSAGIRQMIQRYLREKGI